MGHVVRRVALLAVSALLIGACGTSAEIDDAPSPSPVGLSASPSPSEAAPSPSPTPSTTPVPEGVPARAQLAVVEKVVDGDTIWVRVDEPVEGESLPANAASKIRLLEVDTPEWTSKKECGGSEATGFTRKHASPGTEVWLQADVEDLDRYDRFLRYVWTDDGRMLNERLVRRGWGEAKLYRPNDLHWELMQDAERVAKRNDRGIWGDLCAPDPEPEPEPELAPEPESVCHPSYSPCVPADAADVDCAGGSGDGPEYTGPVKVIGPDDYDLDSDGDGVAC